jgi:hypothetical protein
VTSLIGAGASKAFSATSGNVARHRAARVGLVDHQAARSGDRLEDRLVSSGEVARIDHGAGAALASCRRPVGEVHHVAEGYDGHVVTPRVTLARRTDGIGLVRNLALHVVSALCSKKNRVVVADRGAKKALGVVRRGRDDDLEARNVGEERVERLAVLAGRPRAGAEGGAQHHGGDRLAAEHVSEFGGLVEDLVEADAHEVDEHQSAIGRSPRGRPGRRADGEISARWVSSTRSGPNCGRSLW